MLSAISVQQIHSDPDFPYLYSGSDDFALPQTLLFSKSHVIKKEILKGNAEYYF